MRHWPIAWESTCSNDCPLRTGIGADGIHGSVAIDDGYFVDILVHMVPPVAWFWTVRSRHWYQSRPTLRPVTTIVELPLVCCPVLAMALHETPTWPWLDQMIDRVVWYVPRCLEGIWSPCVLRHAWWHSPSVASFCSYRIFSRTSAKTFVNAPLEN